MKLITMKFGGTSVGGAEAITNLAGIVKTARNAGDRVIVIVSAMSGVTDQLIESAKMAAAGNKWGYLSTADRLRDRHEETLNILLPPGRLREKTIAQIEALLGDYRDICQAVSVLGDSTPRIMDAIIAFGERMSASLPGRRSACSPRRPS